MDADEKVRMNRLRRMAERQGAGLVKSRRRDSRAFDYGRWYVVDPEANDAIIAGGDGTMDIDDVEGWLADLPGEVIELFVSVRERLGAGIGDLSDVSNPAVFPDGRVDFQLGTTIYARGEGDLIVQSLWRGDDRYETFEVHKDGTTTRIGDLLPRGGGST